MKKEYSFLSEGFWKSFGRFVRDDAKHTKNRWFGKGRKYVKKARVYHKKHGLDKNNISGTAKIMMGEDMLPTKNFQNVDKYLNGEANWKKSRSELVDELKGVFKRKEKPLQQLDTSNNSIMPYVAAGGLGLYGFNTALKDN